MCRDIFLSELYQYTGRFMCDDCERWLPDGDVLTCERCRRELCYDCMYDHDCDCGGRCQPFLTMLELEYSCDKCLVNEYVIAGKQYRMFGFNSVYYNIVVNEMTRRRLIWTEPRK